jgi:putative membrane protein
MKLLRVLLALLGVGVVAWFVAEAGPHEILHALGTVGPAALLLLLPYCAVYLLDTVGWMLAFRKGDLPPGSFWLLARVRLVGETINNVIPSAYVGGEPVKAWLLARAGIQRLAAAASVVVAKTTMTLAQVLFIALATLAATLVLPASSPWHGTFVATTVAAVVVVGLLFLLLRRGLFTTLLALLRALRIPWPSLQARAEAFRELDRLVAGFFAKDRRRFAASTLFHLLGWVAGAAEVWAAGRLLDLPIGWAEALTIEAFAHVAKAMGLFIPGSVGVQETGILLLFRIFGHADPFALTYAILRRGRELVFILLGAALWPHGFEGRGPGEP